MYKIPLMDLKDKILRSKKISSAELDGRIKEKINELAGLVSEEGAAHIIANELGVELFPQGKEQLKIKELYAGMRGISTLGKVLRIFETKEFTRNERSGKVCSLMLGDETGTIRIVFWNEMAEKVASFKENDVLLLKDIMVRERNNGDREVHVGERSEIQINPPNLQVTAVRTIPSGYERRSIKELQDGQEGVELLGTVVQVFDPRFFEVCPECNKKVQQSELGVQCITHGTVQPSLAYVLNAVLDDGTGTIRGVFWKNQTHHLLGKGENAMLLYRENVASFQDIKNDLLGEQFKVKGRVKRNEYFDRLELNVQLVEKASPEEELLRLESIQHK